MRVKTFELVEQWPIQEIRSNYIVFQVYVVNRDELSSISCWGSTHIVCLGLPPLNVILNAQEIRHFSSSNRSNLAI